MASCDYKEIERSNWLQVDDTCLVQGVEGVGGLGNVLGFRFA
ncbi:MAG: hypothetical protein WAK17_25755 [Candidatus Nitrosopolaris sp.]